MPQANPYPLRIDADLMEAVKKLAKINGRSVNKEIEYAVRLYVRKQTQERQA